MYLFYQVRSVLDFPLNSTKHPGVFVMHFPFFTYANWKWLLLELQESNQFKYIPSVSSFFSVLSLSAWRELLLHYHSTWLLCDRCSISLPLLCLIMLSLRLQYCRLLLLLSGASTVYFPLKCYSATSYCFEATLLKWRERPFILLNTFLWTTLFHVELKEEFKPCALQISSKLTVIWIPLFKFLLHFSTGFC